MPIDEKTIQESLGYFNYDSDSEAVVKLKELRESYVSQKEVIEKKINEIDEKLGS